MPAEVLLLTAFATATGLLVYRRMKRSASDTQRMNRSMKAAVDRELASEKSPRRNFMLRGAVN
jgi:hypothetical protein